MYSIVLYRLSQMWLELCGVEIWPSNECDGEIQDEYHSEEAENDGLF